MFIYTTQTNKEGNLKLYLVGHYSILKNNIFEIESSHTTIEEAARRCNYLNGGPLIKENKKFIKFTRKLKTFFLSFFSR
jgi:hypothetical protein